ncbi:MAG: GDP-L-fucose synthase family protein [Thermodesulfobacteriota bacterium]
MEKNASIYIAGHRGLAGSALVRKLKQQGYGNLLTRTHAELDLTRQADTEAFLQSARPDCVFVAAAKVGGILANNTYPADFIYQNLVIETNIIDAACRAGVKRLLFLGSSCIYPKACPQPMKEEHLLTGPLEPTNEPYAVAKIAGIKMCQSYNRQYGTRFVAVMPTNLYGPNDNFDLETSHVLPALIRKFHEAKKAGAREVVVWGTGTPRREFLHADDLADACLFVMNLPDSDFDRLVHGADVPLINIGMGKDSTIAELAGLIKEIVGFDGTIRFDTAKPDGTLQKLLDVSRMTALGWRAKIPLKAGLQDTYQWCLDHHVF